MAQYTKKPETIEAWSISSKPIPDWVKNADRSKLIRKQTADGRNYVVIYSGLGKIIVEKNDYIINDDGNFYMMEQTKFEKLYRISGI